MKLNTFFIGAMAGLVLVSCGDKMDYHEDLRLDHAYIDRNFEYVGGFMNIIYNDLDSDFGTYSGAMLSSATDESEFSTAGNAIEDFCNGAWSPVNSRQNIWNKAYEGITYCNEVLDNWQGLTFPEFEMDKDYEKKIHQYNNYRYEARWARAYYYYILVRQYGAVPFKDHNLTGAEETALPRTSAEEIFKFIDDECAAIQDSIVKDYTDLGDLAYGSPEKGRASMFSVMALRAQAALYHASPLFNPNGDANLWYKAAKASQALIDSCQASGRTLASSYNKLWGSGEFYSAADFYSEVLFGRRLAASNSFETNNFPVGYSAGKGGNCPTQDLVDAYEMSNGKAIDEEGSGYDPQNPYANRDPRFAMTIAVNDEAWPTDITNTSYTKLQTFEGGYHARPRTSYATPTGYYLKKLLRDDAGPSASSASPAQQPHIYPRIRYTELFLAYAECANEAWGPKVDGAGLGLSAYDVIKLIRQRGGIGTDENGEFVGDPYLEECGNDQAKMRELIRNERRIELCFENKRFWDIRRWQLPINETALGVQIDQINPELDPVPGNLSYTPLNVESRQYESYQIYGPIPNSEVLLWSNLLQNKGW